MEETVNTSPPPTSAAPKARNEVDSPESPQPSQKEKQQSDPTPALNSPKSFADAARPILSKEKVRAAWGQLRAGRERREEVVQDRPISVAFSRHQLDGLFAVPYDKDRHMVTDVVSAILASFAYVPAIDSDIPGVCYFVLPRTDTSLTPDTAIQSKGGPLEIVPAVWSLGSRIRIRVDQMDLGVMDRRKEILDSIFGDYGKIVHINNHYYKGTRTLMTSFDFVLEIPQGAPGDLMIPRVIPVRGSNVLFIWNSPPFCFRCGLEGHTKALCPCPSDFQLFHAPLVDHPIMARAFPDIKAPPRETPKTTAAPASVAVKNKPSGDTWTVVGPSQQSGKKRGRRALAPISSLDGVTTSASDSDTPRPSRKQPAPRNQSKESATAILPSLSDPVSASALVKTAPTVETEAHASAPSTCVEPQPEVPAPEPTSGTSVSPSVADQAPTPLASDDASETAEQDVAMPTAAPDTPETPLHHPVEPCPTRTVPDTPIPVITISEEPGSTDDVNMTTKQDGMRAKLADKKASRESKIMARKGLDGIFDPASVLVGKKSKAKEKSSAKASTRASGPTVDSMGIPVVVAADHATPSG